MAQDPDSDATIIKMEIFIKVIGSKMSNKGRVSFIPQKKMRYSKETSKIICSMDWELFNTKMEANFRVVLSLG